MSQTETQSEPETGRSLTSLVDEVQQTTDQEVISVGDLLDQFESQSYGPLLLVFGFLALSPVGAIPGMSILLGTIIILIALQILYGKDHPWLPERILKIEFPGKKLSRVIKKLKPWASWIQTFLKQRLVWLTNSPGLRFLALICIFLAISFYPLALIPGGVALPSAAICLLAIGLTTRDGLPVLAGYLIALSAGLLLYRFWPY